MVFGLWAVLLCGPSVRAADSNAGRRSDGAHVRFQRFSSKCTLNFPEARFSLLIETFKNRTYGLRRPYLWVAGYSTK